MGMPAKGQVCHCGILKSRGLMSEDCVSGSKPRMHSFDAVWRKLLLQIQALRDGAGTPSAYDAARHRRDVP
jgi:hypothetical protein